MIKKVKLGDLVEFQRGYDLPRNNANGGKYPVVTSNGIMAYHDKYKSGKSIVVGRSGTVGNPQLIEFNFWPHNTTLYVKDFKNNNVEYIYYLLLNMDVGKMRSGSNIPTLNRNHLHPLKILAETDNKKQKRIARTLKVIDDKIKNNYKINAELESMAKTIYDYWFLQFEFPNEEGKPYKSSGGKMVWNEKLKREIPEGWEVKGIDDFGILSNGINYSKDEIGDKNYKIVNVRNMSDTSLMLDKSNMDNIFLKAKTADNYLLKKEDILIARSGIPGAIRILEGNIEDTIYCGFIIRLRLDSDFYRKYLVYKLKDYENTVATSSGGTIMQNVSQNTLRGIKFAVPEKKYILDFNDKIDNIWAIIENKNKENQELVSLRKFLLPLLMNGQVGFKS